MTFSAVLHKQLFWDFSFGVLGHGTHFQGLCSLPPLSLEVDREDRPWKRG